MKIAETILPQFEHEMSTTRKALERVVAEKFSWKPHEKSFSLGHLASHIVDIPGWTVPTLEQESLDLAPVGGPPFKPSFCETREELLAKFDKNVEAAKESLRKVSDSSMLEDWSLLAGGKTIFTMPKVAVVRSFVLSHIIHHRAQLGLYLRLNDIPHPSMYGPSADEGQIM